MLFVGAAIGAGIAGITALASFISGRKTAKSQEAAAARIEAENPFKAYKRPKEYGTSLGIAEQMAYSPNFAGRGYMEEQVGANTANTIKGINEMGLGGAESAALLGNIYGQEQEGRQQIGVMGAEQQNQGLMTLLQQLGIGGQYSDQEFDYNVAQPYERGAAAASALRGASMANTDNARRGLLNSASSLGYGLMTSNFGKSGGGSAEQPKDVIGEYTQRQSNLNSGAFPKTFGGGFGGQTFQSGAPSLNAGIEGLGDLNNISGADLLKYLQFFQVGGGVQNMGQLR